MNREEWLHKMSLCLLRRIKGAGFNPPARYRVSCGLPHRGAFSEKNRVTGQCWFENVSSDKHVEIFISPTISGSIEVAATLAHELVHACVGPEAGHRGPFRKCALKIGLEGPMKATYPGDELKEFIKGEVSLIGEYPHADLQGEPPQKKQSSRLLKVICNSEDHDEYIVRMSRTTLEKAKPSCGLCGQEMDEQG